MMLAEPAVGINENRCAVPANRPWW